ncbi:class I SAM-dependent methyltransferase [Microbacterium sp. W1N]|uniref:class I SAM-dependent DNA methyltransferase n=1 Tax=Microbacterium festucae TaxID=2977531 RepID=UPI0021BEAD29|nr:class I SAM-dependent methyltransferase [Microbacterium festucae]MCT9821518.1 class I SAM-dependent methyltransferase [Microbacterium festucae]
MSAVSGRVEATRGFYDTVAGAYARLLPDTRAEAPLDLGVIDHFVACLPASDLPVLDAGCGTGRMLSALAARGVSRRHGVDLSPAMIAEARARHAEVPLTVADLADLPFADRSFAGVLCWYAIIHSTPAEVAAIAAELHRVLIPGGVIALGFQAGTGERVIERAYGHDITLHGVRHETDTVAALLSAAGFDILVRVDRAPHGGEHSAQGFVIAARR